MSRFLNMDQAAQELGVSRRTLTTLLKTHPHYVAGGRGKQFYPEDIAALHKARREETQCRITSIGSNAPQTGTSAFKSKAVSGYEEVLEHLTRRKRKLLPKASPIQQ